MAKRTSIANVARLNQLMDEAGLDGLVLRSGQNFTYLSGVVYPGTLQRHMDLTDSTRPVMLVWPRDGKPVIVTNKVASGLVQRDGWIDDMVLYEAYVDSPQKKLAEVLESTGGKQHPVIDLRHSVDAIKFKTSAENVRKIQRTHT